MDVIPWSLVGNYGLPGLFVMAILFGLLVPKSSVDRNQKQFQALLDRIEAERDDWKDTALKSFEREAELLRGPGRVVTQVAEHVAAKDTT